MSHITYILESQPAYKQQSVPEDFISTNPMSDLLFDIIDVCPLANWIALSDIMQQWFIDECFRRNKNLDSKLYTL